MSGSSRVSHSFEMQSHTSRSPAENRFEGSTTEALHRENVIANKSSSSSLMREGNASSDKIDVIGADERSRIATFFDAWGLELIYCVVMVGMLVAIVGVLYPHQGRPLPNWPYHLSINTVVSILATILKAAALSILAAGLSQLKWLWLRKTRPLTHLSRYESASRGPWGCFVLLATSKGRDPTAMLMAFLVLLTLGIDPFTQQLISYYSCLVPSTNSYANIPRSVQFSERGQRSGAGTFLVKLPTISFIAAGLFNPQDVKISFDCPTGHCEFTGRYSSLAYCVTCEDVSDQLKVTNITRNATADDGAPYYINSTLPSGTYASYVGGVAGDWFTMNSTGDGSTIEMVMAATSLTPSNTSDPNSHAFPSLVASYSDDQDGGCSQSWQQSSWGCMGGGAASCSFQPCVKMYEASISGGVLTETVVDTATDWFEASFAGDYALLMADVSDACIGWTQRQTLASLGFNVTNSTLFTPYNVGVDLTNGTLTPVTPMVGSTNNQTGVPSTFPQSQHLDIVPPECIHQFEYYSAESIQNYLAGYLNGALQPSTDGESFNGPSPLLAVFNDSYMNIESVQSMFDSMAKSITIHIRETPDQDPPGLQLDRPAQATVLLADTCVRVKWPFLTFLAATVALTVASLLALLVIADTGRTSRFAHGWKSSLLPLVFRVIEAVGKKDHDHDGEFALEEVLGGGGDTIPARNVDVYSSIRQMEKAADDMRVKIGDSGRP